MCDFYHQSPPRDAYYVTIKYIAAYALGYLEDENTSKDLEEKFDGKYVLCEPLGCGPRASQFFLARAHDVLRIIGSQPTTATTAISFEHSTYRLLY